MTNFLDPFPFADDVLVTCDRSQLHATQIEILKKYHLVYYTEISKSRLDEAIQQEISRRKKINPNYDENIPFVIYLFPAIHLLIQVIEKIPETKANGFRKFFKWHDDLSSRGLVSTLRNQVLKFKARMNDQQ